VSNPSYRRGDPGDEIRVLFEIPIYRLTPEAFAKEQQQAMEPWIEQASYATEAEAWCTAAEITHAHSWHYKEVVGWVSVQGYHDVVKMYLWWTTATRLVRRPLHRQVEANGTLSEIWIRHGDEDRLIRENVRQGLIDALAADGQARGRHADLRAFDAISPHLDWRASLRGCEQRADDRTRRLAADEVLEDPHTMLQAFLNDFKQDGSQVTQPNDHLLSPWVVDD
jgi:hypothetical protein